MTIPVIPRQKYIPLEDIPKDEAYAGLRIVRCQSDAAAGEAYAASRYEFQTEQAKRSIIPGVMLTLKGAPGRYRIAAMMHPTLRQFTDIVRYDPSNPPLEDFAAINMNTAHEQTQQDFRGAKKENLANFKQYLLEAMRQERTAYLPTISGWQSCTAFDDTVFVAFDESNAHALYGMLYLPKQPVMQSDGQTQTAALFQAAASGLAVKSKALDMFTVTLEVELNVTESDAGQGFADRNGRGSKKNKNLVAQLDHSSALAQLRHSVLTGTVFEKRLADGRGGGISETATKNIVDLSTMEQMLLAVMTRGTKRAEHLKHYHIERFEPFCQEFLKLVQDSFAAQWPIETPKDQEAFRRIYVHGWAFALKALAIAYHDSRRDKLGPLVAAMSAVAKDEHATIDEAKRDYDEAVALAEQSAEPPRIEFVELRRRIQEIDWHRYRKHWIALTNYKRDNNGRKKVREIKDPENPGAKKLIVDAQAQNTPASIATVVNKILSDSWQDLCSHEDAELPKTSGRG